MKHKYIKKIEEVIKVPIEVGDTVLGGRFKNKKTVVKKIGKNKKGDVTINGKPLLRYRIIKEWNSFVESITYQEDLKKFIPKELLLITSTGKWKMKVDDESQYHTVVDHMTTQIMYKNVTEEKLIKNPSKVLEDGEPDSLEFDIRLVKENDGTEASATKNLKLNIDITYGDSMNCEFTISPPNKITMGHYTSVKSKYDPKTMFAFSDDSIKKLTEFFNRFSPEYKLTPKDFTFLDKDPDSYTPDYKITDLEAESKPSPFINIKK